jgi:hypothetical protein
LSGADWIVILGIVEALLLCVMPYSRIAFVIALRRQSEGRGDWDDVTMTRKPDHSLEVVDSSHLTDADWAEINKLKRAYETGGMKALSKAMDELAAGDPIIALHVLAWISTA